MAKRGGTKSSRKRKSERVVHISDTTAYSPPGFLMRGSGGKYIKHAVKWIGDGQHPLALRAFLKTAPDGVIKAVANAALNAKRGPIPISPKLKKYFSKHGRQINYLINPSKPVSAKRKYLLQRGSGIGAILGLLAPLVSTVISTIGSKFIPSNNKE